MTWNEDRERLIAAAELGDATPQIAADLLVAARKRAFEAEAAHAWIKTSERMPELHSSVLGVDHHGDVELLDFIPAFRGEPYFRYTNGHRDVARSVSAWMPLPEPPK